MKKFIAIFAIVVLGLLKITACGSSTVRGGKCLGSGSDAIVDLDCREITIAMVNAYLPFNYVVIETGNPEG
jgi:predicted small secreted protein